MNPTVLAIILCTIVVIVFIGFLNIRVGSSPSQRKRIYSHVPAQKREKSKKPKPDPERERALRGLTQLRESIEKSNRSVKDKQRLYGEIATLKEQLRRGRRVIKKADRLVDAGCGDEAIRLLDESIKKNW